MGTPSNTTIKFTQEEEELIAKLKEKWKARTKAETIRRSVGQASSLAKLADENGNLIVFDSNGDKVIVPLFWGS